MGDVAYCKCSCKECGNNIEFPAFAARTTVPCPHCGEWTELLPPETLIEKKGLGIGTWLGIACAAAIAAGAFWMEFHQTPAKTESAPAPVAKAAPKPAPKVAEAAPPIPPPTVVTQAVAVVQTPVKPSRPKAPSDLRIGAVKLEKTPGSSLVYAVGTVKNDSDWERFGVKVEVDLFNAKGDKISSSEDYKDIIEPRQDWQFHALIPDKHTASAKVTSLKEQD